MAKHPKTNKQKPMNKRNSGHKTKNLNKNKKRR